MIDFNFLSKTVETEMARALDLSGLRCELSETFASKEPEHRDRIRQALKKSVSHYSTENLDSLSNLQVLPRLKQEAISVSHCPSLGGFVHLTKKPSLLGIGFDIEIADRVSVAVARKVLPHASELFLQKMVELEDPSVPACIWAAKESAIKSIGNALTDRQIFYGNLALTAFASANDDKCFHFRAGLPDDVDIEARGIVRKTDQWILALAICYSLPPQLEQ